ncbi:MAG TPA: septal ring lytic transglycosylase RlpA family protein [Hanamia sp.]
MFRILTILSLFILFLTNSIAQSNKSDTFSSAGESNNDTKVKYGVASYYADKFKDRQTANGEIYLPEKYTAACNILPLNTWIRVTCVRNNKSVVVKINDRMNAKNKRLVDLSKIAAKKLNLTAYGVIKVKLEVLNGKPPEN